MLPWRNRQRVRLLTERLVVRAHPGAKSFWILYIWKSQIITWFQYEKPYEQQLRNETSRRIGELKNRVMDQLWRMSNNGTAYSTWRQTANDGWESGLKIYVRILEFQNGRVNSRRILGLHEELHDSRWCDIWRWTYQMVIHVKYILLMDSHHNDRWVFTNLDFGRKFELVVEINTDP